MKRGIAPSARSHQGKQMTKSLVQHCPVPMQRVAGLEPVLRYITPVRTQDAASATVIGGSLGRPVRIDALDPMLRGARSTVSHDKEV